jgi:hypothetical protein
MRWSLTDPVGPAGMARAIQNESPLCQDEGWGVQARQFRPVAGRRRVGRSVVAGPGVTEQPAAPPTQAAIPSSWPCRPVSRSSPLPSAHLTADHQTGHTVRSTVPRPARRAAASRLLADGTAMGTPVQPWTGCRTFDELLARVRAEPKRYRARPRHGWVAHRRAGPVESARLEGPAVGHRPLMASIQHRRG